MKKEYNSQIYNAPKAFLYLFILFILLIFFIGLIAVQLKSPLLGGGGFAGACLLPFLFEKRIKALFTKRVFLEFDEQRFTVIIYPLKDDIVLNKLEFNWNDIKSYKIYFTPRKLTYLTLYLKDGSSKTFGFKDDKSFEEAIKEESVFSLFYSYVKQFNADKQPEEKIEVKPGFLTTSAGTVILFGLSGLAVVAAVIHITIARQSSPATLIMGIFMIITLLGKRKQDKDAYNRICKLG